MQTDVHPIYLNGGGPESVHGTKIQVSLTFSYIDEGASHTGIGAYAGQI
jgi:hypothetical protein